MRDLQSAAQAVIEEHASQLDPDGIEFLRVEYRTVGDVARMGARAAG